MFPLTNARYSAWQRLWTTVNLVKSCKTISPIRDDEKTIAALARSRQMLCQHASFMRGRFAANASPALSNAHPAVCAHSLAMSYQPVDHDLALPSAL
jgi:hypothetical protein